MRRLLLIAVLYLGAAVLTSSLGYPTRPLYDGTAPPPPYNWVEPPPDLKDQNLAPLGAVSTIEMTPQGSRARTVSTSDGQAIITVGVGAFDREVEISIKPSAPDGEPPKGIFFDGNAYTFTARETETGKQVEPNDLVTILLRYPVHGTTLVRKDAGTWKTVDSRAVEVQAQVFGRFDQLGTYAVAAPPDRRFPRWAPAIALSILAAIAAILIEWRRKRKARQ